MRIIKSNRSLRSLAATISLAITGLIVLFVAACSSDSIAGPEPLPSNVRVTIGGAPSDGVVLIGAQVTLSATVTDDAGAPVRNAVVSWQSEAPSIASISSSGVVSALAPGGVAALLPCLSRCGRRCPFRPAVRQYLSRRRHSVVL